MSDMGKILIVAGGVLVLSGIVLMLLGRIPGVGRLPGDILIKKDNFTFYFPLMTSLLVSVLLSLLMYFLGRR